MPIYYLEVNIICIVILLMIMEKIHDENKTLRTFNTYKKLLISIIVFSTFDLIAGVFKGTMFPISKIILLISNTLYFFFGVLNAYYFNEYLGIRTEFIKDNKRKAIRVFPVIIVSVLLILNLLFKNLFYLDEYNLYHRGGMLFLYYVISYSYFISVIINLFSTWKTEKISHQELKRLMVFVFIPVLSLIVQIFNYGIALIGVGFTISVLMIFLDGEKNNSTIDELTGVNNRRAFNIFGNKLFNDKNDGMFLMLMDANDFKKINDVYGHLVGDKALIDIANMLKVAIKNTKKDYFLARMGGDEFIIVGNCDNETTIKELITNIKKEETRVNSNHNPYRISMSIGYAIKNDNHHTLANLIMDADAKMYLNKKEFKKLPNL